MMQWNLPYDCVVSDEASNIAICYGILDGRVHEIGKVGYTSLEEVRCDVHDARAD